AATATSSITGAASAGSCSGCLQDCCVASCHDFGRDMDVSQLGISSVSETCAYGGGRGNVDANPCRACAGQGSVFVAQPARQCIQCQGRGRKSVYRCSFCLGTGWVQALRPGTRWAQGLVSQKQEGHIMANYRVISSDNHVFEPPDLWTSRVKPAFKD